MVSTLSRSGIRQIAIQTVLIIFGFAVLFISAGTFAWINAWIYVGLISLYWVISTAVLARVNPELLNARGSAVKQGTKGFDRAWLIVYPLFTYGNLVIMGFDAVRFQWSLMPFWLTCVGIFVFVAVSPLALSAMAVNKFFEWTARIQDDRQQYVCASGPYKIIRHPGYAGLIVSILAYPSILGSWWGFLPGGLLAVVIVIRTALEDSMLQNELAGYREYAARVKYRLVPLLW